MTNNDNGCINAECREAMLAGRTLDDLAGQLRCDPAQLSRLLEVTAVQPVAADDGPDLGRIDELNGVL